MPIYTKEILALRECIQTTIVCIITMSLVADNHFTAFIYRPGSVSIKYRDSMHHQPPGDIIPVLQWVFHGLFETSISEITFGFIPKQGPDNGEGSCGVIAHNFIEITVDAHSNRVQCWNRPESALFRNAVLHDLISFHYASSQSAGDFSDWTSPVLTPGGLEKGQVNISTGSGFNDFNNFSPNVSYFSQSFDDQASYQKPGQNDHPASQLKTSIITIQPIHQPVNLLKVPTLDKLLSIPQSLLPPFTLSTPAYSVSAPLAKKVTSGNPIMFSPPHPGQK
ncbi:uncharacterized protein LACBIDRAFT_327473 [Laccaria bicolor S238N-H82]|uniref:Predicted protein n=1 Tax=Laccaria bicolor (strain S238N-H82 / ATCC MYA-4686) TaxID=486041 RepID=B0DB72_LACBS|nr:uncharacterized protein LACBIDRAFT_327473 [Laccaria bicolor S238N-H82]EDR08146.1 predicted protein [Laccaria bicolor S238N-H82]|eukprot:XP_001881216.1 predicted protein [Laccaria bicolor S238N-H82]